MDPRVNKRRKAREDARAERDNQVYAQGGDAAEKLARRRAREAERAVQKEYGREGVNLSRAGAREVIKQRREASERNRDALIQRMRELEPGWKKDARPAVVGNGVSDTGNGAVSVDPPTPRRPTVITHSSTGGVGGGSGGSRAYYVVINGALYEQGFLVSGAPTEV
jgi:hypothetical protein